MVDGPPKAVLPTVDLYEDLIQMDLTHDLASFIRTRVLLSAQGSRDHVSANALRHNPAFGLALQFRCGTNFVGLCSLAPNRQRAPLWQLTQISTARHAKAIIANLTN